MDVVVQIVLLSVVEHCLIVSKCMSVVECLPGIVERERDTSALLLRGDACA